MSAPRNSTSVSPQTDSIWSVKTDDFFPYSDCAHCFWTGYFTSRAGFKRMERVGSSFLLAARQIESLPVNISLVGSTNNGVVCSPQTATTTCEGPLYDLEDALGIVQHHDAVSGTAKQHVANDYSRRLQAGVNKASTYAIAKLKGMFFNASNVHNSLGDLSFCQLVNETKCEVSQVSHIALLSSP